MKKTILTLTTLVLASLGLFAQEQLDNMSFDKWYKKGAQWFPAATASERVWGTANKGLSLLGRNGAEPEDKIVAVKGEGKRACKIHSENVLWAFASGAIYTGSWVKLIGTKGAEITWGVPFHSRPKALTGYYYYIPKTINFVRKPYQNRKGKLDEGFIQVILTDWDAPYRVNTVEERFVNTETDPHVIGVGKLLLTKDTGGYVKMNIPITYKNDRTPKYVVIACTSSNGGDYFTGADGSTLYVDEFRFVY